MGDSSTDLYQPSGVKEKSRTSPVETKDRMGDSLSDLYQPSGSSPTEKPWITELASGTRDLGKATYMTGKAIPLCLPDNLKWNPQTGEIQKSKHARGKLYVVEEAFAELKQIKDPVCVVSIVGPCRDGKSYILSEAFSQPDVFSVGFKTDPETMGIWMWILPDKIKDSCGDEFRVVLLDSEGIDAAVAKGQDDNQIFTLTVLLASILIYNSKNVPRRSDLDGLKGTREIRNEDAFHRTFPFFIWLLRDVLTELPDDCKNIKEYFLKRIFRPDTSQKDHTQEKIAKGIMHYFSGFDAFYLPPPAFNKDVMKDIRRNKDRMNPEFFAGVEQFKELLKSNMGPKKSCNEGEYVTGEGLATLTKSYVDAINDPRSIPNVPAAWETHVQEKCQEAKRKALIAYDKEMKSTLSMLPYDGEKILTSHEFATAGSTTIFKEETEWITSDNTKMYAKELQDEEIKRLGSWKSKNDRLTKVTCEQLLEKLKREHFDPVLRRLLEAGGTNVSYRAIDNGCSKIEEEYKTRAVGAQNVRAEVFYEFHKVETLHKLQEANLTLNEEKCEFTKPSVQFLGTIINSEGVQVNTKKVEAIKEMAAPKD
ncbi:hypothetical protein OS493_004515 [Desmophyllum pertusum]|uniref:GB1/RHD3-type G domain-containing protein n=1 Tax=Desmophyllum pertusum TaxID=174260 RepID=A0A9W9ZFS2_9CNID|nr:hypothetical protein OS493_004515 [Desmophyllum pertusum]